MAKSLKSEFLSKRTAVFSITIPNASATTSVGSGVFLPAGAIVTGIRWCSPSAVTLTGASATVVLRVGTNNLHATVNVSGLGASATPTSTAVTNAAGYLVPADGELNLLSQASSNSAATATYDYYVDYLYVQ
jgi:hypothetical protein